MHVNSDAASHILQVLTGLGDVCLLRKDKESDMRVLHPPKPGGRCMLLPDLVRIPPSEHSFGNSGFAYMQSIPKASNRCPVLSTCPESGHVLRYMARARPLDPQSPATGACAPGLALYLARCCHHVYRLCGCILVPHEVLLLPSGAGSQHPS